MKPFKEAEGFAEDLQAAYDYYKTYGRRSAERFLAACEAAIKNIRYNPFVSHPRKHGWRQLVILRHPNYSIFYKELADCWLLGGVVSTIRDPDTIQARLLIREVQGGM